ncbi:MAG: hypothetical protein Q9225_000162 [Loekoesia sp. 1 TL-2023]
MLYQFYKEQNLKKPGSIHAVYLLSGFLLPANPAISEPNEPVDGGDAYMQSSPFMSSSMPQKEDDEEPQVVRSIVMCREEDIEDFEQRRTGPKSILTSSMPVVEKRNRTATPAIKAETPSAKSSDSKASLRRTSSQGETKPKDQMSQQSTQEKKGAVKTTGLKRDQSDIFKSFAKPHAKVSRENTDSSAGASEAPQIVWFVS